MYEQYGAFQATTICEPFRSSGGSDPGIAAINRATVSFRRFLFRGQLKRIWARLTRRPVGALPLEETRRSKSIEGIYDSGVRTVEIARIRGSECREHDFDDQFRPLRESLRYRWMSVYAAKVCGVPLPVVSLVQVGETYYVRDGHNRVSVARALGEQFIEASVQVWLVQGEAIAVPTMRMGLLTSG